MPHAIVAVGLPQHARVGSGRRNYCDSANQCEGSKKLQYVEGYLKFEHAALVARGNKEYVGFCSHSSQVTKTPSVELHRPTDSTHYKRITPGTASPIYGSPVSSLDREFWSATAFSLLSGLPARQP